MNTKQILLLTILIGFLQFGLDLNTNTTINDCLKTMNMKMKNKILSSLLFHHISIAFLQYTWIFNNKFITLSRIFVMIVLFIVALTIF